MECPICFENIKYATVGSCLHHFCYFCLINCIKKNINSCPICKETILELRIDHEFDKLLGNTSLPTLQFKNEYIINNYDIPPAITLVNNNFGPGVRILRANSDGSFYKAGIRYNDVIIFINSIPCITHEQTIQIINMCFKNNKNLKLVIV